MTDIVERLARQAAESINGGEFNDGKWYTEGQRQAWRKAVTPYADEIERLRDALILCRRELFHCNGQLVQEYKHTTGSSVKKALLKATKALGGQQND